jgi:hypothetical protein
MDATVNRRDADGKLEVCCPNCKNWYHPALGERTPSGNIPEGGSVTEKEQLMTGLCSDACWDQFLGF